MERCFKKNPSFPTMRGNSVIMALKQITSPQGAKCHQNLNKEMPDCRAHQQPSTYIRNGFLLLTFKYVLYSLLSFLPHFKYHRFKQGCLDTGGGGDKPSHASSLKVNEYSISKQYYWDSVESFHLPPCQETVWERWSWEKLGKMKFLFQYLLPSLHNDWLAESTSNGGLFHLQCNFKAKHLCNKMGWQRPKGC